MKHETVKYGELPKDVQIAYINSFSKKDPDLFINLDSTTTDFECEYIETDYMTTAGKFKLKINDKTYVLKTTDLKNLDDHPFVFHKSKLYFIIKENYAITDTTNLKELSFFKFDKL